MKKVTAVVTNYDLPDGRYLDLTLESLLKQEEVDLELIVVSSALEPPKVPQRVKLMMQPREKFNTENINFGVNNARPDSDVFVVFNDDIILGRFGLFFMAHYCAGNNILLGLLSNCDNGMAYSMSDPLGMPKQAKLSDISDEKIKKIMELNLMGSWPELLFKTQYVFPYCIGFNRKVWEALGGFDVVNLKDPLNDVDFCMRAFEKGIYAYITNKAYCFHFAGTTSTNSLTGKQKEEGEELFQKKYGKLKYNPKPMT